MPNFPDEEDLTFRDLFRCTREGILLCEVLVQLQSGLVAPHYTVADMWRRILFLGAGEMHEEWVAGIMGVTADDMRCDIIEGVRQPRLDARLHDDLCACFSFCESAWLRSRGDDTPDPARPPPH